MAPPSLNDVGEPPRPRAAAARGHRERLLHHATSCTRTIARPARRRRGTRRPSRRGAPRAEAMAPRRSSRVRVCQERLAARPHQHREAERAQLVEARAERERLPRVLREAEPGSSSKALPRQPRCERARPRPHRARARRPPPRRRTPRRRTARSRASPHRPAAVHQHQRRAVLRARAPSSAAGSRATLLTIVAPVRGRAGDLAARWCRWTRARPCATRVR
jgi:hypothetical protein